MHQIIATRPTVPPLLQETSDNYSMDGGAVVFEFITAAGGGVMEVVSAFLGSGGWIYAPVVYGAVFHEGTNRRVARLLRALRSPKPRRGDD